MTRQLLALVAIALLGAAACGHRDRDHAREHELQKQTAAAQAQSAAAQAQSAADQATAQAAEAAAAAAQTRAKETADKLAAAQHAWDDHNAKVRDAQAAIDKARSEAERKAANDKLQALQHEQDELQKQLSAARSDDDKARRDAATHPRKECLDNPLAPGCK